MGSARAWKHGPQTGAERHAAFLKMLIVLGSGLGALLSSACKLTGKQEVQISSSGKVGRGHGGVNSRGAVAVAAAACRGPCTETPHGTEAAMQRSLRQAASLPFKLHHATEGKRICNNYRQRQGA